MCSTPCQREKLEMLKPAKLLCCKLYISESRNALALESIERAVRSHHPESVIVNRFKDEAYNRVGYTLVSPVPEQSSCSAAPLRYAALSMVKAALETITLDLHSGSHPRIGVIDHICFHPLAQATLDCAAALAKSVASDIGCKFHVPTFLYGAAHEGGRTLDEIRRELGYFKPNLAGAQWAGGFGSDLVDLKPDKGPDRLDRARGVAIVGATRWVDNYNVPVGSTDIGAVRRIARQLSGRGGGLESVQAMGLTHGEDSTEVATNLLDPNRVGAEMVQQEVERLAREEGLTVGNGYFTDFSQEKMVEIYSKLITTD